jgi:membrane protein
MSMIKDIIDHIIQNNSFVKKWVRIGKRITLPGFDKVPVYTVIKFLIQESNKDLIPTRARSMAFSFFLAFFPGIIFLLTLLPFIPLNNFQAEFIKVLNEVVPNQVANEFIAFTIDDLLNRPRQGLLSIGAILTLYFSIQGVVSMIMSFNKTYSIYTQRNVFQLYWVAFKLTFILLFLFIISIILIIVGGFIIGKLVVVFEIQSSVTVFFLNVLRYAIIVILFFLSISFIYYYGPSTKKRFRFISPGSTFATITSILASIIFSEYVSSIDRYDNIYGIFGSIIIFLVWLYINAFMILIGFELNASIYYNKALTEQEEPS